MSNQNSRDKIKIAWLINSGFYYWHPLIAHFTEIWSQTKLFAVDWQDYLAGYENSFPVENLGTKKVISFQKNWGGYDYNISYLPLNIVNRVFAYQPEVILVNSFGLWTILALLFKPIGKWRVVLLHEGCSPNVDYRKSWWRLLLRRSMMKVTDACLTNGKLGQEFLIKVLHVPPEKVFVYPYPIPSSRNFAKSQTVAELTNLQQPIFLFVGQIIPRKGLDLLLQAAALLQESGECNYTIVVLGNGSQQQQLEEYCQTHHLTERVHWLGQVEYDRLPAYFQSADVFVLPTLEDVWAVVVLEAMTAGKAILCSQFAGAVEMLRDGENGYSFDPHNVQQLSVLMRKFIDNPELSKEMGKVSQEIMQIYTPENGAKLLTEIVDSWCLEK